MEISLQATQALPSHYALAGSLDINKDKRMLLLLNVLGMGLLIAGGWLFFMAIAALRPVDAYAHFSILFSHSLLETVLLIGAVLALTVVHILVHEAIHGFFFWWFTRSQPQFAFRWTHAYAAAPAWYIPRNRYLLTALAPLVVISLAGLLLVVAAPSGWLLPLWFILTSNAGGSVGDLWVAGWLLRQPVSCLANDRGDAVYLYNPI
jgi:hypothetical protein